jgi:hypothetical protein
LPRVRIPPAAVPPLLGLHLGSTDPPVI